MDWTSGYVADVAYTTGYFSELNPVRLSLGLLNAGYAPPHIENACELGFGQGVSVAMHAASQPGVKWFGDDFNPNHAAYANWLAGAGGAKAVLTDESFAEFCSRDDLPDFDFISLHGVWSWISDENRALIVDFLRRKLKVGGIAYMSYNVLPGWASAMPLRKLMVSHFDTMGGPGQSSLSKIDQAMEMAEKLFDLTPGYVSANPGIKERFDALKTMQKNYLAHEYFNRDWRPMYFTEIADHLKGAKLEHVCSASFAEAVEEAHLLPEQRQFLSEIENENLREMVRDFFGNAQFRKDYWIKGGRILSQAERVEAIRNIRFILTMPRDKAPAKVTTGLGEVTLQEKIYGPILDVLADHKVHTFGDIERAVAKNEIAFIQVLQAMMMLSGISVVNFAQSDKATAAARPAVRKLNSTLIAHAEYSDEIQFLASPVTGGGVGMSRFDQLFLASMKAGRKTPEALAADIWAMLQSQGQKLIKEGETLDSAEENLAELRLSAEQFLKAIPVLRGLDVVDAAAPQSGRKK